VAPGEISFSHSGYSQGSPKSAIASDLTAREFQLVNVESGNTVLTKPVRSMETQIGKFQVMDFSEVTEPGTYVIHAGNRATRPFRIGDDVWKSSLWKALNFFYVERCGYAVPGVHDICHRDWLLLHGDQKLVVNGGWHDAGDLSQSLMNTAEADYAMFSLAEQLQTRADDPALMARLLDEAKWGLDWILKTTFHDGFRPTFSMVDRWTDGIIGNVDDIVAEAGNSPDGNFAAAAAEAVAARVLRGTDPILAAHALKQAKEDWDFAMAGTSSTNSDRRRGNQTDLIGHAVLATLELWQTTGERPYADKAVELSRKIVDSQQRTFLTGLDYPLTGFFYTGPDKTRILRYSHVSHEEAPVTALVRLCELFPNDPAWMKWYSAVTLYSDYFQAAMARFTQPYGMLANSVYRDDEYLQVPEGRGRNGMTREAYRDQILNGVKVGEHYYVRLFPVWFGFRGNYGTVLSQTAALAAAAHLRGNFELAALAQQQLEWVVGRNPFVQSTMWGEGYDYAPQYTAMSGDIVGSLPVGIQSHRNADAPYWPAENCHNWKEVWVLPVGRWISLMRDLSGPAELSGTVETTSLKPVEILRAGSEKITTVVPDEKTGSFHVRLPEGRYEISSGAERRSLTLLPGGSYDVDLTPGAAIHLSLSQETRDNGEMVIRAELAGSGRHTLVLRSDNLSVGESERVIELKTGTLQKMEWRAKLKSSDAPWVAVVLPDNNFSQRKELTGSVQQIGVFHSKTAVEKSHPVPAN
jgi:Glycosyl hydrolase family 9/Cellulase N-terminal ig-like domain